MGRPVVWALCIALLCSDVYSQQLPTASVPAQQPSVAANVVSPFGSIQYAGSVVIAGTVDSSFAGCPVADGHALVTVTVANLPANFSIAAVRCQFVPRQTVDAVSGEAWAANGTYSLASGPASMVQFVHKVIEAEGVVATVEPVVSLDSTASPESREFAVSCLMPGCSQPTVPVIVAESRGNQSQGAQASVLMVGQLAPGHIQGMTSVLQASPLAGPAEGGTRITIQGQGLANPVLCTFSNGTLASVVRASVLSASHAACVSPPWFIQSDNLIQLNITAGGCQTSFRYGYYLQPLIRAVIPPEGPRFGSFGFTLALQDSIQQLDSSMAAPSLTLVRISGAAHDGSDLLLPASLTQNGSALVVRTPNTSLPLTAGRHALSISLNTQQFSDASMQPAASIRIAGPTVAMSQPYVHYDGQATVVTVTVELQGSNALPVAVDASVAQRSLISSGTVRTGQAQVQLSTSSMRWDAGSSGQRNLSLVIANSGPDALSLGAVVVTLSNATNADLDLQQSTTIVSALPAFDFQVSFEAAPNQVAYRNDTVTVPITITNAKVRVPAAIGYSLQSLTSSSLDFIPAANRTGLLTWDMGGGSQLNLTIPVDWSRVPYQAEYRIGLQFGRTWNTVGLQPQRNATAVFMFGVRPGQCPPGTVRRSDSSTAPNATAVAPGPSPPAAEDARLGAIIVRGQNGTMFDLSSQFQPDVAEYGMMVPETFSNATLCLRPIQDASQVDVYGPDGTSMPRVSSTLRRQLLSSATDSADKATAAATAAANAKAIRSPAGPSVNASAVCQAHAWMLALAAGQNAFTIKVTAPAFVGQPPALAPALPPANPSPHASSPRSPSPPAPQAPVQVVTNSTEHDLYTLSVVRLAEPSHAELSLLNVTEGDTTFAVCGDGNGTVPFTPQVHPATSASDAGSLLPCSPGMPIYLNVSYDTDWLLLHPKLRFPAIQGIRVEVRDQVLSQGGDVSADQMADTNGNLQARQNQDFLPAAVILGLSPGVPVEVPIVVVAEDGVTSLRYYVYITRALDPWPADNATLADAAGSVLSEGDLNSSLSIVHARSQTTSHDVLIDLTMDDPLPPGWPVPPSHSPQCSICPAGWASTAVDADRCQLCSPGSFAAAQQSPACTPCTAGSYAYSWGSTHCPHCIIGTYSPREGSKLCTMCPDSLTNHEDGSSSCPVPVLPGTNLTIRYAVIISFGVFFNGTTLSEIATRVGVNATSEAVLEHLIRADTALAFNISQGDVEVTGISQVARRLLYVNVTATLGVDVPPGASEEDIQTALQVKDLSADDPIAMLSEDPDKFFGRTTKALDVTASSDGSPATRMQSRPTILGGGHHGLAWWAVLLICLSGVVVFGGFARLYHRRNRRFCAAVIGRLSPVRAWHRRVGAEGEGLSDVGPANPSSSGLISRVRTAKEGPLDTQPIIVSAEYSDGTSRAI